MTERGRTRNCILSWSGATLVLLLLLLLPHRLFAQNSELRVSLHDASGAPIAGVAISVHDEDGYELAQARTGRDGTAHFTGLSSVVRVLIMGQAPGGLPLYQLGDDAQGVRLDLAQAGETPRLDLRVERDGLVLPDPVTMITREEGGPDVSEAPPIPTAALATPALLPTAPAASDLPTVVMGDPVEARPSSSVWVPWITVLIVAVAAGVMRLIQRRRDAR